MQRYFVNQEQIDNDKVIITGDDVHHIAKVLRSKIGDEIICSDGNGKDVVASIVSIEETRVVCKVESDCIPTREPEVQITLAQGLPKSDKMDLIIQKGTEIGVSSFLPFVSERTVVQLNEKKEQKRLERWNKIAKEAAEQSHRSKIPNISPVIQFKELLKYMDDSLVFIAYEKEDTMSLYKALSDKQIKKIMLIIGPEGGFSENEINRAIESGAISISLGKRILRTETAGLVGAANILYHLEEGLRN